MPALSKQKLAALRAVAAGSIQYGHPYPNLARRRPDLSLPVEWLDDGAEVYGQYRRTFTALETAGLIRVRHDEVPMVTRPAETRTRTNLSGSQETYTVPERRVTADPGWRARVEVTERGHALLVKDGLVRLDGSEQSAVRLLTGMTDEELDDLGGFG